MTDPLAQVITLLRPRAVFSKVVSGAGAWAVRYTEFGQPSFCAMLEGQCLLAVAGQEAVTLQAGDFVLLPATPGFTLSALQPGATTPLLRDPHDLPPVPEGEHGLRHGTPEGPPDMRMLGGYFAFESADAALLVSLLPALLHVHGSERLLTLVQLVRQECLAALPGRDLVLERLVELLLIEALRSGHHEGAPPGLLRGLADARVAVGLRLMHSAPERAWTVQALAREAALSRSTFFERFSRAVGLPPMEYLLAWRMALAKQLLSAGRLGVADVAERVGYSSASTFSTAFSRHVGVPPGRFARQG